MDLSGKKYGKLFVLEKTNNKTSSGDYKYKCICDCGKETLVVGTNLKNGHSKSCGCERYKNISFLSKGHRKNNIRLYNIYFNMKQRCYYSKSISYKNYGNRGITVCDEWLNDYLSFEKWAIENGYQDNLTLDRINVNGNYEPNNCRWASKIQQANNTSTNRRIEYNRETKTLAEWALQLNMSQQKLKYRLDHWDIKKAFEK